MKVYRGLEQYPADAPAVVATVGNYDGVHLGHQAILRALVAEARRRRLPALVVSFEPHPLAVLAPERKPALLQTPRQKLEALEAAGADAVLIQRFDRSLAACSAEGFIREVLGARLRLAALFVGENFRFGRGQEGDVSLLRRLGEALGFAVHAVRAVTVDGERVSSTRIREAVRAGRVREAARLLGRPFAVEGSVVPGAGRGGPLGFPTANLEADNELLPARGVYITEALALAARYGSVTNVGVRPTFGGSSLVVEAHLLGFEGHLSGERMELRFLERLRDERRFASPAELADQIARDRAAAESYFQNAVWEAGGSRRR